MVVNIGNEKGDLIMTKPTVTQADREAADRWQHCEDNQAAMCQAFAAHREAAERTTIEKVVEWLRGRHSGQLVSQVAIAACATVAENGRKWAMTDLVELYADALLDSDFDEYTYSIKRGNLRKLVSEIARLSAALEKAEAKNAVAEKMAGIIKEAHEYLVHGGYLGQDAGLIWQTEQVWEEWKGLTDDS